MLGQLPLFLCKPLRYHIQTVYSLSLFICVFYITLHSWLSPLQTLRATSVIWKQQCSSEKSLDLQHKHNLCSWTITGTAGFYGELLGTWRSNRASSAPDLWSSRCFVFGWSRVFLLHTDPRSARQNQRKRSDASTRSWTQGSNEWWRLGPV